MSPEEVDLSQLVRFMSQDDNKLLFIIPSQTGKHAPYQVIFHPKNRKHVDMDLWTCECNDFKFRGEKHLRYQCKHIKAVISFLQGMVNT